MVVLLNHTPDLRKSQCIGRVSRLQISTAVNEKFLKKTGCQREIIFYLAKFRAVPIGFHIFMLYTELLSRDIFK